MGDGNGFRFRADPDKVFVVRFWLPLIMLLGIAGILARGRHPYGFSAPALLLAVFYLSAAQIRPRDGWLEYRRFLRWKQIPYDIVCRCEVSLFPGMGSLKLRHFAPPWGRIYFVLEGPLLERSLPGGQTQLTAFINARSAGRKEPEICSVEDQEQLGGGLRACVWMCVAGFLITLLSNLLFPNLPMFHNRPTSATRPISFYYRHVGAATEWPWNLVVCVLLAAGILLLRFKHRAWILAFGLGATLGVIVLSGMP